MRAVFFKLSVFVQYVDKRGVPHRNFFKNIVVESDDEERINQIVQEKWESEGYEMTKIEEIFTYIFPYKIIPLFDYEFERIPQPHSTLH